MAIFRSQSAKLRLSLPPEQFGMGIGVKGEDAPLQTVKFNNGMYISDNLQIIEGLRRHPANTKVVSHTGDKRVSFWEESKEETIALNKFAGKPMAYAPDGGLSEEDTKDFETLNAISDTFPNPRRREIIAILQRVHERFSFTGVEYPDDDLSVRRTKGRAIEMMGILEDCKITKR